MHLRTYSTYGTIGSGVNVVEIKQTRDSYYDEKYRNNCANYGQYEAKNNYMTQVEDYLNEFLLQVSQRNTAISLMQLTSLQLHQLTLLQRTSLLIMPRV